MPLKRQSRPIYLQSRLSTATLFSNPDRQLTNVQTSHGLSWWGGIRIFVRRGTSRRYMPLVHVLTWASYEAKHRLVSHPLRQTWPGRNQRGGVDRWRRQSIVRMLVGHWWGDSFDALSSPPRNLSHNQLRPAWRLIQRRCYDQTSKRWPT